MLRLSERNLSLLNNCTANDSNFIEDKSQQTAGQAAETGQNLFERCIYAMLLLREKRVVLSPMLERKAPAHGKSSQPLLCSGIAVQYPSVEKTLPLELTFCFTALRNLCGSTL